MTHKLKCWPEFFWATVDGHKRFEFRRDDRGFEAGDELVLMEFDPTSQVVTGRTVTVVVDRVFHDIPGLPERYCIMSLSDKMVVDCGT